MSHHVTVAFGDDRNYEFEFKDTEFDGLERDTARAWLSHQFDDLECTPSNPMGKALVPDMVLKVAKEGGEERFREGDEWAQQFARMTAAALHRSAVRVDIAGFRIG